MDFNPVCFSSGMRALTRGFLNVLFPPACFGCDILLSSFVRTPTLAGRRSPQNDPDYPTLCDGCCVKVLRWRPGVDTTDPQRGAVSYGNPAVRALVQALKFQGVRSCAVPLGFFIARRLAYRPRGTALVPVPLGTKRMRERGYNQADLIARTISLRTGIPVLEGVLRRTYDTRPQTTMRNRDARLKNIAGCFVAAPLPPFCSTLILIDDVTTSGATFREAEQAIRRRHDGTIACIAAAQA